MTRPISYRFAVLVALTVAASACGVMKGGKHTNTPVLGQRVSVLTGEGDVVRLVDVEPPEYRLRVGDWRVRFAREDEHRLLHVLRVMPRGKAYR